MKSALIPAVMICLILISPRNARCQDVDAVTKLTEKVELLEVENDALKKELVNLRRELAARRPRGDIAIKDAKNRAVGPKVAKDQQHSRVDPQPIVEYWRAAWKDPQAGWRLTSWAEVRLTDQRIVLTRLANLLDSNAAEFYDVTRNNGDWTWVQEAGGTQTRVVLKRIDDRTYEGLATIQNPHISQVSRTVRLVRISSRAELAQEVSGVITYLDSVIQLIDNQIDICNRQRGAAQIKWNQQNFFNNLYNLTPNINDVIFSATPGAYAIEAGRLRTDRAQLSSMLEAARAFQLRLP